jgi:hypothetical protein
MVGGWYGKFGNAGSPESHGGMFRIVLLSLLSVFPSPPSKERLFPSFGGSTRAWNAFPEALGHGA